MIVDKLNDFFFKQSENATSEEDVGGLEHKHQGMRKIWWNFKHILRSIVFDRCRSLNLKKNLF